MSNFDSPDTCIRIINTGNEERKMNTYTVTAVLKVLHTDTVEANSLEEAWAIVDEWSADDFTEDYDCSRAWDIQIDEVQ